MLHHDNTHQKKVREVLLPTEKEEFRTKKIPGIKRLHNRDKKVISSHGHG